MQMSVHKAFIKMTSPICIHFNQVSECLLCLFLIQHLFWCYNCDDVVLMTVTLHLRPQIQSWKWKDTLHYFKIQKGMSLGKLVLHFHSRLQSAVCCLESTVHKLLWRSPEVPPPPLTDRWQKGKQTFGKGSHIPWTSVSPSGQNAVLASLAFYLRCYDFPLSCLEYLHKSPQEQGVYPKLRSSRTFHQTTRCWCYLLQ